jgi:hypothetical protein
VQLADIDHFACPLIVRRKALSATTKSNSQGAVQCDSGVRRVEYPGEIVERIKSKIAIFCRSSLATQLPNSTARIPRTSMKSGESALRLR